MAGLSGTPEAVRRRSPARFMSWTFFLLVIATANFCKRALAEVANVQAIGSQDFPGEAEASDGVLSCGTPGLRSPSRPWYEPPSPPHADPRCETPTGRLRSRPEAFSRLRALRATIYAA